MEIISSNNISSDKGSVAFFDLDRTIISVNSARILIHAAYKKGLMTMRDIIKGYYLSLLYKFNLRDPAEIIKSISGWLNGVSVTDMEILTEELFKNQIANFIHKEVYSEINFHKRNDCRIAILSSSIYPVCRQVADHLEIDDIVCSKLEVQDGVYTGHSIGPFCFGKEKAIRLKEYCSEKKINPVDTWYYGDAISDLYVLSTVGNPVCVNPDKKLKEAAIQRGWKILLWQ